jgi:hypothetical protein
MDEHHPPHGNEPPSKNAQPGDAPQHDEHDHPDHQHDGEVCCRDTILTINGHSIDLAREPLKLEFCGFTLNVSYSAAKERTPGEKHVEEYRGFEIVIIGPDKGDPLQGRPPGRLFINGKHIEYLYKPTNGNIHHHGMFSVHKSLIDFAHAYISANPALADIGHHH